MTNNVLDFKEDILRYKNRTSNLLKKQKSIDSEIFYLENDFEKKNRHFSNEIANIQTDLFKIKKDTKRLRNTIKNILISLESFAKKEHVEKLKELNDKISLSNYITVNELQKIIEINMK